MKQTIIVVAYGPKEYKFLLSSRRSITNSQSNIAVVEKKSKIRKKIIKRRSRVLWHSDSCHEPRRKRRLLVSRQ